MKYKEIFNPSTIALIGADNREKSVGRGLAENLSISEKKVFYINPFIDKVLDKKTLKNVLDVKERIDLAVIAVPFKSVMQVVDDCIQAQVKSIIIVSAGFKETGKEGEKVEKEIAEKLNESGILLVGPNCLGIIRPSIKLNASFAPLTPRPGKIALISQSGALIDSIIDSSVNENYGFSTIVSVGNSAGLDFNDYLEWASQDKETEVVALYVEGVKDGRKFFNAVKKSVKPVVVLKGGSTEKGIKSVASHTGSLAGESQIFSSAMRQAGAIEVESIEELFDVCKALSWQKKFNGGVGVITNGGGAGVLLVDSLKVDLPETSKDSIKKLNQFMHPGYSAVNPIDILGDADSIRYEKAIETVVNQKNIGAIAVIQTVQIMTDPIKNAEKIIELSKKSKKTFITVFMGGRSETQKAVNLLEKNEIPNYTDPSRAAKVLNFLKK